MGVTRASTMERGALLIGRTAGSASVLGWYVLSMYFGGHGWRFGEDGKRMHFLVLWWIMEWRVLISAIECLFVVQSAVRGRGDGDVVMCDVDGEDVGWSCLGADLRGEHIWSAFDIASLFSSFRPLGH